MTSAGRLIPAALARLRRTCIRCGAETTDLRDARVGFSCCESAARAQLAWRTDELERLRRDAKAEQARVDELELEARNASGYKADEAIARADRARRGLERRLREHYQPLADELKADIARAEAAVERLSRKE